MAKSKKNKTPKLKKDGTPKKSGGARKGAGRKAGPSYTSYLKAYNKEKEEMDALGVSMKERKLSKLEFETEYTALLNEGVDKKKITKKLVESQTYSLSWKQVRAITKEGKEDGEGDKKESGREKLEKILGEKINLNDKDMLRKLRSGDWMKRILKEQTKIYDDLGIDNAEREAQKYIGTEFFGS